MTDKIITNFALNPDENTISQFNECVSQDFVIKASLMPDAHSGYVAPIGSVLVTKDTVVPAWVGYDIGCGMIAYKITGENLVEKIKEKKKQIFEEVNKKVPMGVGKIGVHGDVSNEIRQRFRKLLEEFKKGEFTEEVFKFLNTQAEAHLGSLGSGNHFIELGISDSEKKTKDDENSTSQTTSSPNTTPLQNREKDSSLWLVVHSGSRGVGRFVATHYMREAAGKQKGYENTYGLLFSSKIGKEYYNAMKFCLDFALLNREEIAKRVFNVLQEVVGEILSMEMWVNKNHNHVLSYESEFQETKKERSKFFIHRKGATPARRGERGVIPANMRDGCFLVEGLGSEKFLNSSSHGAGRLLSRREANKKVAMKEFVDSMKGVVGKVNNETLDEAPQAYKNIYDVMEKQKDSVEIIDKISPIINWKG